MVYSFYYMPKIGAHVSAAGFISRSFQRASEIDADCFQIFISPPQQWIQTKHSENEVAEFKKLQSESKIAPNFIHGTYLINLGTDNPEHLRKSIDWLIYSQKTAGELSLKGTIFHPGSHKKRGFDSVETQVINSLETILKETPDGVELILETTAGGGGSIGSFQELGKLLKQLNHPQLKVCLDSAHIFATGFDLRTKEGVYTMVQEFDHLIGLENLSVIHCNDSKVEFGSGRDRHENIGEGFIGKEGFSYLLNHPKLKDQVFILEVPGFSGDGPDKENIDILRSLVRY